MSSLIRKAVAVAYSVVGKLDIPVTVTHYPWISQDVFGAPTYAPVGVPYSVIFDERQQQKRDEEGIVVSTRAYLAFLEPIAPNAAAGRLNPLDPRDKIVLPDGTTGPIVSSSGFVDKGTGKPYFHEVWIGYSGESGTTKEGA